MSKATVSTKGISFVVEFDYSAADRSVNWPEQVDLCSVRQEGSEEGTCILECLTQHWRELIEEAVRIDYAAEREGAMQDQADAMRERMAEERMAA